MFKRNMADEYLRISREISLLPDPGEEIVRNMSGIDFLENDGEINSSTGTETILPWKHRPWGHSRKRRRGRGKVLESGVDVAPFYSFADISYLGEKVRLSFNLSLSLTTFSPQIPQIQTGSRRVCKFKIKSLEGRLGMGSSPLRIQDIRISTGPQLDPAITTHTARSFTCSDQSPSKLDATVSGVSYSSGGSGAVSIGYPQSVGVSTTRNWGETIQRPPACLGLNLKDMEIGIDSNNQFVWRYPVLRNNDLRHKSVKFENHTGSITYPTTQSPTSMRTAATMTCDVNTSRFSRAFVHLRRLIPSRSKIKDGNTMYPCRHVRFNLQVDLFPDDTGQFWFPQKDEGGGCLDLGEYFFKDGGNGVLVLEIQRKDGVPVYTTQPQMTDVSPNPASETRTIDIASLQRLQFEQRERTETGIKTSQRYTLDSTLEIDLRRSRHVSKNRNSHSSHSDSYQ